MGPGCFRVKVNLSNFFRDVRRVCWLFVDETKTSKICHVQERIAKLFDIHEQFHLLLREEYLPPGEDVRVLKEDETILVVPGSGLDIEVTNVSVGAQNDCDNRESIDDTVLVHKEVQTVNVEEIQKEEDTSMDLTFHNAISAVESKEETESEAMQLSSQKDFDLGKLVPRRKRIRKRKQKQIIVPTLPITRTEEKKPKKPRIIDSCVLSAGRHIRFDTPDHDNTPETEVTLKKPVREKQEVMENGIQNKSNGDLSLLLALKQNSTPLTFSSKRSKEIKIESSLDNESEYSSDSEEKSKRPSGLSSNKSLNESKTENNMDIPQIDLEKLDISKYPVMTQKPQVNDVIVFKMLRIGVNYTPEISDFILASVLSFSGSSYTLKILKGTEQIQTPVGKFTLEEEIENTRQDVISIAFQEMIEPRLIHQSCKPIL